MESTQAILSYSHAAMRAKKDTSKKEKYHNKMGWLKG